MTIQPLLPAPVEPVAPAPTPTATVRTRVRVPLRFPDGYATSADVLTFAGLVDGREHLLLGLGDWQGSLDRAAAGGRAPLVRPHSECLTGDVFGSQRCDCGPQLREAVEWIAGTERVPTGVHPSPANRPYLAAKADRSHFLGLE